MNCIHALDLSRYGTREKHFHPSYRQAFSLGAIRPQNLYVSREIEAPLQLMSSRRAYMAALAIHRGVLSVC